MRSVFRNSLIGVAALTASAFTPSVASACGGFFCNQAQPVNQAAEGIIFADNGDGTVTAVIQIKYQGPSTNFSWLLPIASAPKSIDDIGIASNLALQRLQNATNPNYTLTTRVEGTCKDDNTRNGVPTGAFASGGSSSIAVGPQDSGTGVNVELSGTVGPFALVVFSLDKSLADPADTAVNWLETNGYDVPGGAANLLGPYLAEGLHLLALKLTKGADTGSIRPLVLTYTGAPSIPIKLTAVAANDDMGVLTWVLGQSRAVPQNYLSLELNEARINWFNASSNYNAVVIEAANDAGGQGFVTEFAGASSTLTGVVWGPQDDANWTSFKTGLYQSFGDFFSQAYARYGQFDGFWDATKASVALPANVAFDDFKLCPNCYASQLPLSSLTGYLAALQKDVIDPMTSVQNLIDAHPEITRMYTTLSADEMTLDPLFTFNPELGDVSNQHSAERVIECNASIYQSQASWRIELPQGGVVRGTAAQIGTWPQDLGTLSPNRRILQSGASGMGKVLEDNSGTIGSALASYDSTVPSSAPSSSGGCNLAGGRAPLGAFVVLSALGAFAAFGARRRRRS